MRWLAGLLFPVLSFATGGSAELARGVREVALDPGECYRVHDLQINKDEIHFYFTDGYLIFGKPVGESRTAAVFVANVEAGDAELLLLPPNRSERQSLNAYTGSPNLDEHFGSAVILFGDDSYRELIEQIHGNDFNRRAPEMGAMMADEWTSIVRNLSASFESRLLLDLLSPQHRQQGVFVASVSGRKLGNFDVIYEPRSAEQIAVGQLILRNGRAAFNMWTSFESAAFRKGVRKRAWSEFSLKDYRIDATLEPDLQLRVVTKVKATLAESGKRALPLDISGRMRVSSATVDGEPAEVLQPESLRSNLIRNNGNDLFLVVASRELEPGREHEVELRHEGAVVVDAGRQIYYVGPRGTWYPNAGMQFAHFDLNFRYPQALDLVTPGEVVADGTEGEWRVTRRSTSAAIRFAGFNLGSYERVRVTRSGYTVEVCANRAVEDALQPKAAPPVPSKAGAVAPAATQPPSPPIPAARLHDLAEDVISAIEFMAARFGPPPLKTLEVSPIPGTFGQGFPGLIYLSTMSYLRREDAVMASLDPGQQSFFTDLLQVHETAHQWWGNVVTSAGYHDDWLMESLANYSALLYLEKRNGRQSLDAVLEGYKKELLARDEKNRTVESSGPIVLGTRLESAPAPSAWRVITYGKGSWILHMLRAQMGDDRFISMLAELRRRYEWKTVTTDQFRVLAAEFLPPKSKDAKLEAFFDQWVYGTGVPALTLTYSLRGKAPAVTLTGVISQTDVDDEFSVQAPVEIQLSRDKQVTWVRTSSEPVTFTVALKEAPAKVSLDSSGILAVEK